jgi:Alkylmercury lyase
VTIELLYFDGCPNHESVLARLRELLDRSQRSADVVLRRIDDDEAAQRERFLGSPTVRVDGRDIEPGADKRDDYGIKCRLYATPAGITGMPPDDWLLGALVGRRPSAAQRAAALGGPERELHRRLVRAFADGSAPSASRVEDWAGELGLDADEAAAELARHDLVHRDPGSGAVTVAYPFSAAPTRHCVRLSSGTEVFAMCAIDALGVAFMLEEGTTIVSADPATGERIDISLPLDAPSVWSPNEAVVVAGSHGNGTSRACTCPHTNFAASPTHADTLLETDPAVVGEVLTMPDAIARGREAFGPLLQRDAQEGTHAEPDRA